MILKTMDRTFEQRKEEFMKKYEELVNELKCDVASMPQYFPTGNGSFGTMLIKDVVDLEKQGIPSPFMKDENFG